MSDFQGILVILGAVLTIAWAISLLVGVWKIHDALVDKEYQPLDLTEGGKAFRIMVTRVRGRFGATYQLGKDSQVETVPPTFATVNAATAHVRRLVAAIK